MIVKGPITGFGKREREGLAPLQRALGIEDGKEFVGWVHIRGRPKEFFRFINPGHGFACTDSHFGGIEGLSGETNKDSADESTRRGLGGSGRRS